MFKQINTHSTTNIYKEIKIVIVGSSGSGKTSFYTKWTKGKFEAIYKATIMTDFTSKIITYKGKGYKIQFWDIAGQDKNIYTSRIFTKDALGCLIMCDITNDKTMNDTIRWKKSINENTHFVNGESIPCVLIQNKIDLFEKDALDISEEELKKFAMENGYVNYFRTSCKEGIGVDESMDYLISMIIDGIMEYEEKLKGTGNKMEYTEQRSAQTMNILNNNNGNVGFGGNGLEGKCC